MHFDLFIAAGVCLGVALCAIIIGLAVHILLGDDNDQ
jgi:hypothetical protein